MKKLLSIIIPVYNTSKYLKDCIDSILISTRNFEIILINDGSTDSSGEICDFYSKNDDRVKVIHKKNEGVSIARNIGIDHASGKFIMFVDSDDILGNNWDKIFDYISDNDLYIFDKRFDNTISREKLITYILGINNFNICIGAPFRKVIKKSIILKNNIRFNKDVINGEDMLFNLEVLLNSDSYSIIPFSYYFYRQSIGQSTRKFNKKIVKSELSFNAILNDIFSKYELNSEFFSDIKHIASANSIIVILNRISYIENYETAKEFFSFLSNDFFEQIINNQYNSKKIKLVFKLIKKRKYKTLFYIFKIKNYINIKLKKEELVNI